MQRVIGSISAIKLRQFNAKVVMIFLFWFLAMFPGRLGYDYSLAIRMIQQGNSTNWWTGIYFWFLRLTTFEGRSIFLASFLGLLALTYALWFFLSSLISDRKILERTFLVVTLFPLYGVFGVTVSHDVFQTSGILLILGLSWRVRVREISNREFIVNFMLGSLLLITTQIGIFTVLAGCIFFIKSSFRKYSVIVLASAVVVSLAGNIGIGESIIKHPAMNVLLSDIKCVAQHPQAEISESDWAVLSFIAAKSLWQTPLSCSNPDAQIASIQMADKELQFNQEFVKTYVRIVSANPAIVLQAHLQRSLGALPPPFFQGPENQVDRNINNPVGQGTNTALQLGPELLHPSIDEPSVADKIGFLKPLESLAQIPTFLVNQASWFWGWGGLWLYPILFYYIFRLRVRGLKALVALLFPIAILHISHVAIGPGPLGRYYFSTILAGFSLSIAITLQYLSKDRANNV